MKMTHLSGTEPMELSALLEFLNHPLHDNAKSTAVDMSSLTSVELMADKMACGSQLLRAWVLYQALFRNDIQTFKDLATRMWRRGVLGSTHDTDEALSRALDLSTWYGRVTKEYAQKLFQFIETQDVLSFERHIQATHMWDERTVKSFLDSKGGTGPRALAFTVVAASRDQTAGRACEKVRNFLLAISAACPAISLQLTRENCLTTCRDIVKVAVHVVKVWVTFFTFVNYAGSYIV